MIDENYVSLDTAKRLQEKNFSYNALCYWYYILEGNEYVDYGEMVHPSYGERNEHPELYVAAPSLSLTAKWLRQQHNIVLVVDYEYECDFTSYYYKIYKLGKNGQPEQVAVTGVSYDKDNNPTVHIVGYRDYFRGIHEYATYEEACEEGIKYCLENFI